MKKTILLLSLVGLVSITRAQTLTNAGFEKWTNKFFYSNPAIYASTNLNLFVAGLSANVTRVTDSKSGTYAARMTNVAVGMDTLFGGLFLGNPAQGGLTGGYPFDQRPDSFGLFYKSQYSAIDTGMIILFFKKAGGVIGVAGLNITGTHSSYTRICSEVTFFNSSTPDSIAMIMFSGNPDGKLMPGSYLQLDSLFLTGATKKLPNHSFENWQDVKSEEADDWLSSNSFLGAGSSPNVVKSTDKHGGTYSVKITTAAAGFGQNTGFVTNGKVGGEGGPKGGTPVLSNNPKKVSFWYKYTPVGGDSGLAGVWTNKWDPKGDSAEILEKKLLKLTAASNWTYKEIILTYDGKTKRADSVVLAFAASDLEGNQTGAMVGSMLMIDDVAWEFYPSAIKQFYGSVFKAWPVPAKYTLNLELSSFIGNEATLKIIGTNGILVREEKIQVKNGKSVTDVSGLTNGNYLVEIINESGNWRMPFIVLN
ncbi:MAG: T9SS type A sorting domain-containing protein [Bacteroidia bacterium]